MRKLINLRNAATQFRAAIAQDELTIEMYGDIGESFWGDGITAAQVSAALNAAPNARAITVRLNSPGGDAFEGVAIYNILKNHPAPVTVVIDGLAASAASIIAMAGDKVVMGTGTMLMIHPAMMLCFGTSVDMRTGADTLEKVTGQMADIYHAKTGLDKPVLLDMMYAETWMTPVDAMSNGFADGMTDTEGTAKAMAANFDLSVFAKVPEELKTFKADEEQTPIKTVVTSELPLLRLRQRMLETL